jgi:chorismate-pyruvate lyase
MNAAPSSDWNKGVKHMSDHLLKIEEICDFAVELEKSLLWPLNLFYAQDGREMPELTPLFEEQMPEPYRRLLVHNFNMTPTLEHHHSGTIHIEPIHMVIADEETTREIVLRMDRDEKPVEYGASRIFFPAVTGQARRMIKEAKIPLGTVLRICDCRHTVHSSGYFRIRPSDFFLQVFDMQHKSSLFGRRTTLVALDGQTIAEVCEVLPLESGLI